MGSNAPSSALPRLPRLLWVPPSPPPQPSVPRAPSPAGKGGVKRCFPECAVRLAPTQGGLWSPGRAEAAA